MTMPMSRRSTTTTSSLLTFRHDRIQPLKMSSKQEEQTEITDILTNNGESSSSTETTFHQESNAFKYQSLLSEVGLDSQIKSLSELQSKRLISRNGVFCNRELKMSGIRAIGFDMDYTIAQYKQPAFDCLAFDGAKVSSRSYCSYPMVVYVVVFNCYYYMIISSSFNLL